MRLIDDDREAPVPMLPADIVENEGEFLDGGDDDLLTGVQKPAEVTRAVGVTDGRAHLHEATDRLVDLLVQDATIRNDDN